MKSHTISGRQYSDEGKCCKEIAQTAGKVVEPWPKCEPPPPAWRCECYRGPQPANYDPYRIKVPDVTVPPLPPSNAKELPSEDARELFLNPEISFGRDNASQIRDLFHNSPIVHPDYWKEQPERKLTDVVKDVLPKLGYHGRNKYKFAFHEPWKPLDRMALLQQAEREELVIDDSEPNKQQF
ncbi:Threonine ammonia-lyase, biosynthetic [Operophtera brumata]|uniref:Threonine ammonia-lyase, biosynthetic n=1 Tax=Operophtera brumata TaxID=104452 RepID=A0A0L7LSS1_OPEBR|nr:Threonine ammonia-lyase, biosynthetic [Operophtera brumata]